MEDMKAVITIDVIKSKNSIDLVKNFLKENKIDFNYSSDDLVIKFLRYQCISLNSDLWKYEWVDSDIIPLAGDSAQLICREVKFIPEILRMIRFKLRPLNLRIGIGIGSIGHYLFEERNPWNRSGYAFYNARQAIDKISNGSNKTTYVILDKKNIKKYAYLQEAINTIFMLIDNIHSKWSDSKWKSVQAYDKYGLYEKAAEALDISRQAVSKNCKLAKFDIVKESEKTIKKLLEESVRVTTEEIFGEFF